MSKGLKGSILKSNNDQASSYSLKFICSYLIELTSNLGTCCSFLSYIIQSYCKNFSGASHIENFRYLHSYQNAFSGIVMYIKHLVYISTSFTSEKEIGFFFKSFVDSQMVSND